MEKYRAVKFGNQWGWGQHPGWADRKERRERREQSRAALSGARRALRKNATANRNPTFAARWDRAWSHRIA